jgi:hypothetical protein
MRAASTNFADTCMAGYLYLPEEYLESQHCRMHKSTYARGMEAVMLRSLGLLGGKLSRVLHHNRPLFRAITHLCDSGLRLGG